MNFPKNYFFYKKLMCMTLLYMPLQTVTMQVPFYKDSRIQNLHIASAKGDVKTIERLIQMGVPVNAWDYKLNTPLHIAAEHIQPEAIKTLLKHNAQVNFQNRNGDTPLHLAFLTPKKRIAQCPLLLLENGANITIKNFYHHRPDCYLFSNPGVSPLDNSQEDFEFIFPVHAALLHSKLEILYNKQLREEQKK